MPRLTRMVRIVTLCFASSHYYYDCEKKEKKKLAKSEIHERTRVRE